VLLSYKLTQSRMWSIIQRSQPTAKSNTNKPSTADRALILLPTSSILRPAFATVAPCTHRLACRPIGLAPGLAPVVNLPPSGQLRPFGGRTPAFAPVRPAAHTTRRLPTPLRGRRYPSRVGASIGRHLSARTLHYPPSECHLQRWHCWSTVLQSG
jgi:hypothetical protein